MIKFNKRPKLLVIGDLMIDHYLWGDCNRISPEAPVQVVDVKKETTLLGGAGNVINNLLSLGSNVGVISVVGNDSVAKKLRLMLDERGANSFLIEQEGRKTSKKSRVMASNSQVIRYDHESKNYISSNSEKKIFEKFKGVIDDYEMILFSDYGKGVITKNLSIKIIEYSKKHDKKVIVDPKGEDYSKYKGAYFLTPNKKEAQIASKIEIKDNDSLKKALLKIKIDSNLSYSIITLSEQGIAFLKNDEVVIYPTVSREVFDVTGAGDTVLASLAFSLTLGNSLTTSLEFANLAAGVVVGKLGNGTVTLDEIEEYKTTLDKNFIEFHIKKIDEIEKITHRLKKQGKKVVFTNGCFDILHKGHVSYLSEAKSFGDVLILGLNSDNSVKRLKGKNRPINSQDDRAYILSALKCVDYVVIFDEDNPHKLITTINPDILVKGADYEGKRIVGSDIVKDTRLVKFIDKKSTTKIINKIQNIGN